MTGQLAEVSGRLATVRQLDAVVGAMRGLAAARAQQSRNLLPAIRTYAQVVAQSMAQALLLLPGGLPARSPAGGRAGLVAFGAEQGFAGAFNERVLEALAAEPAGAEIFLIGARTVARAAEHGIRPAWTAPMASHLEGLARLAQRLGEALYAAIRDHGLIRVELLLPEWTPQAGLRIERHSLLPLGRDAFPQPAPRQPPLLNLPAAALVDGLAEEYIHARLREAVTIAFAAENEARVSALASARSNIERMLGELGVTERQLRQEGITSEVLELTGGTRAAARQRGT